MVKGKGMVREHGIVRYKRGRNQKYEGRTYIIRYKVGQGEKEIRFLEEIDTDVSFHSGDKITVETEGDMITVRNNTIGTSVTGKKV